MNKINVSINDCVKEEEGKETGKEKKIYITTANEFAFKYLGKWLKIFKIITFIYVYNLWFVLTNKDEEAIIRIFKRSSSNKRDKEDENNWMRLKRFYSSHMMIFFFAQYSQRFSCSN